MSEKYCGFEVHELALVIPEMREDEFEELKADIKAHGIRDQIVTYEGKILDGRHRARVLDELGKSHDPDYFSEYDPNVDGKSPQAFVLSCNLKRRHLSKGQLAAFAAEMDDLTPMPSAAEIEKAQREAALEAKGLPPKAGDIFSELPKKPSSKTSKIVQQKADALQVNPYYIEQAAALKKKSPALFEEVKSGSITLPEAIRRLTAAPPARASQNCEIRATDKIKKLLKQAEAAGGKLDIELEEYSISVEHILAERYR
jgi:hypothetical protein